MRELLREFDIAVVGGGPAGLAAALWAARYRRRVLLTDACLQRNRWTSSVHGYLGAAGFSPAQLVQRGRAELRRFAGVELRLEQAVSHVRAHDDELRFDLALSDGTWTSAARIILATGVADDFPTIDRVTDFYGRSVFTCPSCDGYETQGRTVALIGGSDEIAGFALNLLDWAAHVIVVVDPAQPAADPTMTALRHACVEVVSGRVSAFEGDAAAVRAVRLDDGRTVACSAVFCMMRHRQQSELPAVLGCRFDENGSVIVDEHGQTSAAGVYAAGDMTPGPHLVQVAAAKGAVAGIGAAVSMHGEVGAAGAPRPAPTMPT